MADHIETLRVGDLTIHIDHDGCPTDPRQHDNLGTMICLHRRYRLGDSHDYRAKNHSGWEDLERHIRRDHPRAVVLPLFLFDHSGLTISTDDTMFRACDPQRWDWGRAGLIYAAPDAIRAEYGVRRVSRTLRAKVEEVLRSEVAVYDQYLRGEAYCYTVESPDGQVLDSCCGYTKLSHAIEEARAAAEALA